MDYIKVFLIATGVSFGTNAIITPILIFLAKRFSWYDSSNERKIHIAPTPRIGGVGVFISFVIGILVFYLILGKTTLSASKLSVFQISMIIVSLTGFFALGIIDDYLTLNAKLKFFVQAVLTILLIDAGFKFNGIYIPYFQITLELKFFSYVLTFLWIIGISNAVNLIDGMDGLAGGTSFLSLISIGLYSFFISDLNLSILAFTLAASVLAFLIFNFPPAKIFMGDAGSYVLGLTLAFVPLLNVEYNNKAIYLSITVCMIPICDTLASIIRRMIIKKQSFFQPDKEHTHHKLLALGLSTTQALVVIYMISICLGFSTVIWALFQNDLSIYLMIFLWILILFFFVALSFSYRKYYVNNPENQKFQELQRDMKIKMLKNSHKNSES